MLLSWVLKLSQMFPTKCKLKDICHFLQGNISFCLLSLTSGETPVRDWAATDHYFYLAFESHEKPQSRSLCPVSGVCLTHVACGCIGLIVCARSCAQCYTPPPESRVSGTIRRLKSLGASAPVCHRVFIINLMIIFIINCLWNVKKVWKNAHHSFPKPNVTSSNYFFWPNSSPKHKDSSFMMINDTEKQQILTLKRLNQKLILPFYLKTETINY